MNARQALALIPLLALAAGCRQTLIEGDVYDAISRLPVYGAKVSYSGRSVMLFTVSRFKLRYHQKTQGLLIVTAPGYHSESRQPSLKGSPVRLDIPMRGKEIPGLSGILVWGEREMNRLRLDVRLLDAAGMAMEHFPYVELRGEARIFENLGSEASPVRGAVLFDGEPELYWDSSSKLEKLKGVIAYSRIAKPRAGISKGVLDFSLHTAQGRFSWTRADIPLQ